MREVFTGLTEARASASYFGRNLGLAQYRQITISLDGVFFDDGTFVGPDNTGYFAEMKAMIDAKYDLLHEVELGLKNGKSVEEILAPIDALTNGPKVELGENPTPLEYYNFYKRLFAREPLGVRKAFSDENARRGALVNSLKKISKPWAKVQKLQGGSMTQER